jgi:hypothetical protein
MKRMISNNNSYKFNIIRKIKGNIRKRNSFIRVLIINIIRWVRKIKADNLIKIKKIYNKNNNTKNKIYKNSTNNYYQK